MSTTIEPGLPVEIGQIDKALGRLWEDSGDTKTRASLVNLAIYTENAECVGGLTELVADIASEHACRALLVLANPQAEQSEAKAWINAHCHLAGKGEGQICSEQITFQLDGEMVNVLPNLVFSHLDSDLPLYLWWHDDEFREPLDERLWVWIDRLIYDSASWVEPAKQLALTRKITEISAGRTLLCDLNWTRLLGTRFALAQLFDHAGILCRLESIDRVAITAANRTTGLLLLGWLAAQLGWKYENLLGRGFFLGANGNHTEFSVEEKSGAEIGRCVFECGDMSFGLTREADPTYYHAHIDDPVGGEASFLLAAGKSDLAEILVIELSRGGKHPLYTKALAVIEPLLH